MSATAVIALIALVVSIGAGAAAILSVVLQFRESKRRDEELDLLRQQVEGQEEDRRRHERARLSVFAGVPAQRRGGGIEYHVPVQNIGDAGASQIAVELVDGGGVKIGTSALITSLVPGEKAYATVVTPSVFAGPYEIFFEWLDGRGPNRAASGVQVGPPAA
jgi:hypothetical protein